MKVGILTQHRVIHYGSVLQAFALQQFLFSVGIDNEIIDYVYPNEMHIKVKVKRTIRSRISGIFRTILAKMLICKNDVIYSKIQDFIDNRLIKTPSSYKSPTELANECPEYDIYLTGSDQVWNTDYLNGDTSFFFPFVKKGKSKIISYASSFGKFTFTGEKATNWLNNLLQYDSISVREQNAVKIIEQYLDLKIETVLDPTLLLNKRYWESFASLNIIPERPYILVYILTYSWNPFPYAENLVEYIQRQTGYDVVVIEPETLAISHPEWNYYKNFSPEEFVGLFTKASLVITTSFHGVAFSSNLEIPFIAIANDENIFDDRITSLLRQIDLEESIVYNNSTFHMPEHIAFNKSREILEELRKDSVNYLMNAIYKSNV